MAGVGHNSGRVAEGGAGWRRFAWGQARQALLPRLPVEVVRLRVRRARELGLPYRTYAGVLASTGHDLIGFLFSSNALHVLTPGEVMPRARAEVLEALINTDRVGLMRPGLDQGPPLDRAYPGPLPHQSWADTRDHLKAVMRMHGAPADRYLLVGDLTEERDWAVALGAAGYLTAACYFEGRAA